MKITREIGLSDFDAVEISSAIQARVVRADGFAVKVTADEELMDQVAVLKHGSTLRAYIKFRITVRGMFGRMGDANPVMVEIGMPDLKALRASGAAGVEATGFETAHPLDVDASGASRVRIAASASAVRVDASGASSLDMAGSCQTLQATISGASHINLSALTADSVRADVSGASLLRVIAREHLDYALSGASQFEFQGSPRIGQTSTSGASRVRSS
jgi:hypothetical protein